MFTRGIIGHLFLPIEGERLDKIQDSRFHSSHKKGLITKIKYTFMMKMMHSFIWGSGISTHVYISSLTFKKMNKNSKILYQYPDANKQEDYV